VRARVAAPLVAALLGIAGGTVTALVTEAEDTEPEAPVAAEDPLGLGIPFVELECAPEHGVLVLGFGDTRPALKVAINENPDGDPSYLDTRESCDTIYGPERRNTQPRYAVVLGPYDDLDAPCLLRMNPVRRGDFVTALRSGNAMTVKCVCVLGDVAERPELRVGMVSTDANAVWVRSLQGMLADVDKGKADGFQEAWVTGTYDQRTADRVRVFQGSSNGRSEPGVVDDDTWGLLKQRICGRYDF
jgi:hypothetical protein